MGFSFFAVAGLELGALHDREVQINDPTANIGVLSGLLPYTKYRIYIFARTKEGRGEPTFIEAWTTPEQGEKILGWDREDNSEIIFLIFQRKFLIYLRKFF